jgi:hypothetical protein
LDAAFGPPALLGAATLAGALAWLLARRARRMAGR